MSGELAVLVGDVLAGVVTRLRGRLTFSYADSYREGGSRTPLSISMPVQSRDHTDQAIAPWLAGLLPDDERVLSRWSRHFHVANTPFALLGTPVGEDCAGAVRFVDFARVEAVMTGEGAVEWLDEAGVAQRIRDLRRDSSAWLGANFSGRFSLAGAQAKTALLHQDGRWGVPSGAAVTSHILKPAIDGFEGHDLNEHLCLRAAGRAGLLATRTSIATFEDESAVVAQRYDRDPSTTGLLRRIHQEDLCQANGTPPQLKYQNEGGPNSSDITRLLRRALPGPDADDAIWRFFDALTLNWLICGTDAHAKNYSLLLAGPSVRLAPLYDVASALPYDVPVNKLRLAMKFGGSYLLTARTHGMWVKVSQELGLPYPAVVARAAGLMDRLPDAFADAAREPDTQSIRSDLPTRLVDAVAVRVEACRKTLDPGS